MGNTNNELLFNIYGSINRAIYETPGIGRKTQQRLAFYVIGMSNQDKTTG